MSEVTIEAIAKLLKEEFKIELDPIKTRLVAIEEVLATHTAALEQLLTEKKNKDEGKTISAERFDRLEHWAFQVGKKLGIKLEL